MEIMIAFSSIILVLIAFFLIWWFHFPSEKESKELSDAMAGKIPSEKPFKKKSLFKNWHFWFMVCGLLGILLLISE